MIFVMLVQLTSIYYIGNLDDAVLMAGVGMGNMLINVMGMAVIFGFNGAIETLVSQAYGFGKYKLCGVFLNRGKSVVTAILIPIIVLFVYSDKILIGIG